MHARARAGAHADEKLRARSITTPVDDNGARCCRHFYSRERVQRWLTRSISAKRAVLMTLSVLPLSLGRRTCFSQFMAMLVIRRIGECVGVCVWVYEMRRLCIYFLFSKVTYCLRASNKCEKDTRNECIALLMYCFRSRLLHWRIYIYALSRGNR